MALTRSQVSIVDINDGQQGESGHSYILDIVGGPRSITYDEFGNPPSVNFNFSAELYVDGVPVTPSSYSWSTEGGLSGSGTGSTFVPTLNTVADVSTLPGTSVKLSVVFDGVTIKRSEPLAIAQVGETGEKGDTGSRGPAGRSITSVDVWYYLSTSSTSLTGGSWSTTAPAWVNGRYMWSKTITTYSTGDPTESTPVCITGAKGATGSTGGTGATGRGVSSIVEEFYLSTSKTTQTGGNWSTTAPTWSPGKYVWTRSKITYTSGTPATDTTTPLVSSEWEAVNEIQVGGRNLIKGTRMNGVAFRYDHVNKAGEGGLRIQSTLGITETIKQPNQYTISMNIRGVSGVDIILYMISSSGNLPITFVRKTDLTENFQKVSLTFTPHRAELTDLYVYTTYTSTAYSAWFEIEPNSLKLEKGNKATDWTPAPEDITAKINTDVAAARTYAETKANDARVAAEGVAVAKAALAETNAKAYADGIVSDEELARIAEAENVLIAAQGYADTRAVDEAQAAKNYADTVNAALAAQLGTEIDGLQVAWTYDTVAPFAPFDNMIWVDTTLVPNVPKRWVASANTWIPLSVSSLEDIGAYAASEGSALAANFATFKQSFDNGEYITKVIDSAAFEDVLSGKFDKTSFATAFEQNAASIRASVATVKETADGAAANYKTITNYLDFSGDGLLLGESGSALQVNITNEELQFLNANNKIAHINGSDMYITKANITNKIKIGVHELEKHDANITILRWVGEDN